MDFFQAAITTRPSPTCLHPALLVVRAVLWNIFSWKLVILVVKISEMTFITFKKLRKLLFLDEFCGNLGPHNYVSMRHLVTSCIAPKLRRAHFEGSKLHGAQIEGSKTPQGKFAINLWPTKFWTPQSAPRGVLDPSICAPQSFGPLKVCPAES